MFGKFKRRNDRKQRISSWLGSERDSDIQSLDVPNIISGVGSYIAALRRGRDRRGSAGADAESAGRPS